MMLGAGRLKDEIDLSVGIVLNKKVGDVVKEGESLLTIHSNRENVDDVIKKLDESIEIQAQATTTLIHKIIQSRSVICTPFKSTFNCYGFSRYR